MLLPKRYSCLRCDDFYDHNSCSFSINQTLSPLYHNAKRCPLILRSHDHNTSQTKSKISFSFRLPPDLHVAMALGDVLRLLLLLVVSLLSSGVYLFVSWLKGVVSHAHPWRRERRLREKRMRRALSFAAWEQDALELDRLRGREVWKAQPDSPWCVPRARNGIGGEAHQVLAPVAPPHFQPCILCYPWRFCHQ